MRRKDWAARLNAYLQEVASQPYDDATHNCGTFVAGAVEAMTGQDFAGPYTDGVKTLKGQIARLKRAGFETHADLAASLFDEIHPSQARAGDLAAFATDDPLGIALGVVNGERAFVLRPDGIGTLETLTAARAFRV